MAENDKRKLRPYKLSHIRKCFPLISDPVVARWIEKGYVSHGKIQRGTMPLYTFSLAELIHVGILSFMSSYGIVRSQMPISVMTIEGISTAGDRLIGSVWPLTEPTSITQLYQDRSFDLCYVFESSMSFLQEGVVFSGSRNKQALLEHRALIVSPRMVPSLLADFLSDLPMVAGISIPAQLILHVGMLAREVGEILGIENTWVSWR